MRNSFIQKCILLTCFILTIYPLIRFWWSEEATNNDSSDEIHYQRKYPELEHEVNKYESQVKETFEHNVSVHKTENPDGLFNENPRDNFANKIIKVPSNNHLAGAQREQDEIENRYKALVNFSTTLPINRKYQKLRPDDRFRVVESKPKTDRNGKRNNSELNDNVELARELFRGNFVKHNQINDTSISLQLKQSRINDSLSNVKFRTKPIKDVSRTDKLQNRLGTVLNKSKNNQNSFANVEPLPDYDLPMISKDSVNKIASSGIDALKTLDNQNLQSNEIVSQEIIDPQMLDVVVVGSINTSCSYAVFSTTTENREALSFVFLLPLTVLAWKRVGFESAVVIVGSHEEWNYDPMYRYIMMTLKRLGALIIFLEPRPEKSVMISQVSRIFVANILHSSFRNHSGIDEVYLVTSDADIWPLTSNAYHLPRNMDILSLNSDCCAPFSHRDRKYRMLPMANVGARIRTWRTLTETFGSKPKTVDDILSVFVREFGPMALRSVNKGDNNGWFLDQMMISILIENFIKDNSEAKTRYVKFVSRDVGIDRIDRNSWMIGNEIGDKIDSHLLLETFTPSVWIRVLQLVRLMYGVRTDEYDFCVEYYEQFQDHFIAKYRLGH